VDDEEEDDDDHLLLLLLFCSGIRRKDTPARLPAGKDGRDEQRATTITNSFFVAIFDESKRIDIICCRVLSLSVSSLTPLSCCDPREVRGKWQKRANHKSQKRAADLSRPCVPTMVAADAFILVRNFLEILFHKRSTSAKSRLITYGDLV
jgi:hypothetical protein